MDGWNIHKQTSQGSNIKMVKSTTNSPLRICNYFIYKLTMQDVDASHSHMSSG